MKVYLATKNSGKLLAAKAAFSRYQIDILSLDREYPEIQADTSSEIAKYTALQAARDVGESAIREDHSLFIKCLRIPGPYTSFIERRVPVDVLLRILDLFPDRSGYFEVAACCAHPDGTFQEFSYQVPIELAGEERGTLKSGWSRIIMLKGETRTFAEYPETERLQIWNKNYEKIAQYLRHKYSLKNR